MPLNLYRRHSRVDGKCAGGHAADSISYEPEELRRAWKKCHCPIYASGILGGTFRRKNTKAWTWEAAKAAAKVWDSAGSWDGEPPPAAPSLQFEPATPEQVTIDRAVQAFLEEHSQQAYNTQRKYKFLLEKLRRYSAHKGYVGIKCWTPIDVREFRNGWNVKAKTASNDMTTIRQFFEFALQNEWIERNPARLIKAAPRQTAAETQSAERIPFSDDELRRMYEACDSKYGKQTVKWSRIIHHLEVRGEYARYNYKWTGQDLADFISLSTYTGLRISDVVNFRVDRLKDDGEVEIRTTKNGRKVYTWIPQWLQDRIRARAEQHGPCIFGEHKTEDTNVWTDIWRRKLKKLWKLCGPFEQKPTPHRFRHTFVRILLQTGVDVRTVAELIGDTEDMVRRHYSRWVPERQERVTNILKAAFGEKPRPRLAVVSSNR